MSDKSFEEDPEDPEGPEDPEDPEDPESDYYTEPDGDDDSGRTGALKEHQESRRQIGLWTGFFGTVAVTAVLVAAIIVIPAFPEVESESLYKLSPSDGLFIYLVAILAAHAVVTVSAVWFGYQMIRAAERLLLPLDKAENAYDLLGMKAPQDHGRKLLEVLQDELLPTMEEFVNKAKNFVSFPDQDSGQKD